MAKKYILTHLFKFEDGVRSPQINPGTGKQIVHVSEPREEAELQQWLSRWVDNYSGNYAHVSIVDKSQVPGHAIRTVLNEKTGSVRHVAFG